MNEELVLAQCKLEVDTRIAALRSASRCQIDAGIARVISYGAALVDVGMVDSSYRDEVKTKADAAADERNHYLDQLEFGLLSFFMQLAAIAGACASAVAIFLGRSVPDDYFYLLGFTAFILQGVFFVASFLGYKVIMSEALKYKVRMVVAVSLVGFVSYFTTACWLEARYATV